jgi:hypothetical protein
VTRAARETFGHSFIQHFLKAAFLGVLPFGCYAQADVQPRGSGSLTVFVQNIDHNAVIANSGSKAPGGSGFNRSISLELDYGLTDRLSVTVGLPYVFGKYTDPVLPPPPVSPGDSCRCLQSDWQDFGLSARYNVYRSRRLYVTPSISAGIPSHNYEFTGQTAPGRNLKELALSVDVSRRLSRNAWFSGRYSYSFVEKALDISTNRSNLILEGDYAMLRRKLLVRGIAVLQRTHGGLRVILPEEGKSEFNTPERKLQRNRLFRDNHFRVGGGASYSLGRVVVLGSVIFHVSGRNTHAETILTVAMRYSFNWRPGSYFSPSNK